MTIIVCALTPNGIVLAADSRQVVASASGQWHIDSDYAQKIFRLNPHLGVAILGQGTFYTDRELSPQSFCAIIRAAARDLPQGCTVKTAAAILQAHAGEALRTHQSISNTEHARLAFYVGGYSSPEAEWGELYRCDIPGNVQLERTTEDVGLVWSGQREIIDRLILGYDPRLYQLLPDNSALEEAFGQYRPKLQMHINFQTMPLQDAVDLTVLLVRSTIEFQKLSDGIVGVPGQFPTCGGAIDVAVIKPVDGFRWLRHKRLETKTLPFQ